MGCRRAEFLMQSNKCSVPNQPVLAFQRYRGPYSSLVLWATFEGSASRHILHYPSADPNQFCVTYHGSTETSPGLTLTNTTAKLCSESAMITFSLTIHHQQGPTCRTQRGPCVAIRSMPCSGRDGDAHSTGQVKAEQLQAVGCEREAPPGQTDGQKLLGPERAQPRRGATLTVGYVGSSVTVCHS